MTDPKDIKTELHGLLLGKRPKAKDVMEKVDEYLDSILQSAAGEVEGMEWYSDAREYNRGYNRAIRDVKNKILNKYLPNE